MFIPNYESSQMSYVYLYIGDFVNSKKEGFGKEETIDFHYEGSFTADHHHGKGKIVYKAFGDRYEGDFNKGLIEGQGVYCWKNKETYSGFFHKGMMQGTGIYKWPNGREFHGCYHENLKEGAGEFRWRNGKILKCTYVKGKPSGLGFLIDKKNSTEKVINTEEIKKVLKSEKQLNKEHSFLEYINTDADINDLHYDLCSLNNDNED